MTTTAHRLPAAPAPTRRTAFDWVFAALVLLGAVWGFQRYGASMDVYEKGIAACAVPAAIALGWFWAPLRPLMLLVALTSGAAMALYLRATDDFGVDLAQGEQVFWLKYMLSSQSAILWMSLLLFMSTAFYWSGLVLRRDTPTLLGSKLAWAGVFMALVGTLVRWFESHQIAPDIGHIPVSNLYEVFVLFSWMTTLFWLYYEDRYRKAGQPLGGLGAFVMLVVSAAVGFLLWYALTRNAHEIQPLVPALQSWWMKIHVPANFVGYGTFALAAMVALAYLLKTATPRALWVGLVGVPGVLIALPLLGFALLGDLQPDTFGAVAKSLRMIGVLLAFFIVVIAARGWINPRTPSPEVADDVMYKAIAVGFAFFTIATILGAFWAAEAWGGYWSWDPKETWALIVWLNYAAWLHMRLMKGLRGTFAAWWSLVGLVVTTFAFLGVNMFLSGLHSYGQL
ncbi:c-type cytochrome biogenesis protein CcsB [Aquabacterium soli]|uniref:C-type cytochrome biogenesis protein CcsB n=1 Tax=Aquabacterium soli TaxID=2493092 RepID=A0A3R8SA04_9BURK|nr:c-type cytochrome biogenesis protein CcsB [Aquabacterium soli]RRS04878.1 c-type cytochrome biogenesis protein CcsB [Aquabacterium soli]